MDLSRVSLHWSFFQLLTEHLLSMKSFSWQLLNIYGFLNLFNLCYRYFFPLLFSLLFSDLVISPSKWIMDCHFSLLSWSFYPRYWVHPLLKRGAGRLWTAEHASDGSQVRNTVLSPLLCHEIFVPCLFLMFLIALTLCPLLLNSALLHTTGFEYFLCTSLCCAGHTGQNKPSRGFSCITFTLKLLSSHLLSHPATCFLVF